MSKTTLKGKLALVTGGGRGIGRAIALELSRHGAKLAIADLDRQAADAVALELSSLGGEARAYALDVTKRIDFETIAARIEGEFAPIEILVNNAGLMTLGSFFDHGDREDKLQIEVNVLGVVNGMRAVIPRMRARGRGHVVNIASMAGRIGTPHAAIYSATKHAVIGLTESVRAEMFDSGIGFSYVMPTLVNTELISGAGRPIWPPVVQPADVAVAVRHAIEHNQLDVYVPKVGRVSTLLPALLPQPALDWIARKLRVDKMFARVDPVRRKAYLDRTSGKDEPPTQKERRAAS